MVLPRAVLHTLHVLSSETVATRGAAPGPTYSPVTAKLCPFLQAVAGMLAMPPILSWVMGIAT